MGTLDSIRDTVSDTFSVESDPLTGMPEVTLDTDNDALNQDPTAPDTDAEITDGYTVGEAIDDAPSVTESIRGIDDGIQALGEQVAGNTYLQIIAVLLGAGILSYVFGQIVTFEV